MKILITGINGQVGSALVRQAQDKGLEVVAISREQWDMAQAPEQGEELVLEAKPDLVINPAAYTNVDGAEDDEATALKVNADAPRALAKGCKQLDIPIFHVSTDYVFDGTKEEPYVETDQTNPINAYGRTKLAGELAVQEETEKYIILRTSWLFSKDGKNFVNTILRLAKDRNELKVVNDQYGGPTNAECIAEVLLQLTTGHKDQWGTYHYSDQPFVSWFEFAKKIVEKGVKGGVLSKAPVIKPCGSDEFPVKAKRPKNSRLSNDNLARLLGISACNWGEKISLFLNEKIYVTKAYLPNKNKYKKYLDYIYESGWLTNNGALLQCLEKRLADFLGVKHLICVSNGSIALQVAYKALNLKGEVITSPFSFVATTSTLVWEGLTPVFCDINDKSFNLDSDCIVRLISKKTSAILPVHVFGNPCDVKSIQKIANKYNLKVIYDAAHAFNVDFSKKNVLNFGDISIVSFHSTKLFHTIEGGALITNNDALAQKIRKSINFGITGPESIDGVGTNAKMNEFQAAMGLCVLDDIDFIHEQRKNIWSLYRKGLEGLVYFQQWNSKSNNNYAYAPILLKTELDVVNLQNFLEGHNIYTRRYFYPSLDTLGYLKGNSSCNISHDISSRILCLPIYPGLDLKKVKLIVKLVRIFLKK